MAEFFWRQFWNHERQQPCWKALPILRKTETEVIVARYSFPDGNCERCKPDVLDRRELERNGVASVGAGMKRRTYWMPRVMEACCRT